MLYRFAKNTVFLLLVLLISCVGQSKEQKARNPIKQSTTEIAKSEAIANDTTLMVGANQTETYLPLLKDKKVGFIGNQTSVIFKKEGYTHIVDSLLSRDIAIKKVFSPEHGFRGTASAGEAVENQIDKKTGIPIISLYGNHQKPTSKDLRDLDILVFDIQDVGLRFYTYLSTLHYIMEAAGESDIPLLILDRPNPNGNYIDGPILEKEFKSFVGLDPIPVVHGMTLGEYAQMANGESWLKNGVKANINIIKVKNYKKEDFYSLPIKPSPNLPNDQAINLYPSLCFFEGTDVNAGRGTNLQFQVFGSPNLDSNYFDYKYTPKSNPGAANPKHEGELCFGRDLSQTKKLSKINLEWLIEAYKNTKNQDQFFNAFFNKLSGTANLQQQIKEGLSSEEIKKSWEGGLKTYDKMRQPYLLY